MEIYISQGGGGCDSCGYGGEGQCEFKCKAEVWEMDLMNFSDQIEFNKKISIAEICPLFWAFDDDKKEGID